MRRLVLILVVLALGVAFAARPFPKPHPHFPPDYPIGVPTPPVQPIPWVP